MKVTISKAIKEKLKDILIKDEYELEELKKILDTNNLSEKYKINKSLDSSYNYKLGEIFYS